MADDPVSEDPQQQAQQLQDEDPQIAAAVQYLHSPMFIALAVALIAHVLKLIGRHVSDAIINGWVQEGLEVVTLAALIFAGYKRWRSKVQPLTLTKAKAAQIAAGQVLVKAPSIPLDPPSPEKKP